MTTEEFSSSHLIVAEYSYIATCSLRILINIIWLYIQIPTQPHIYTHTQIVAHIIDISFVLGLGKFTLNYCSPNPVTSNINRMPKINVISYQTTYTEKSKQQFSSGGR